MTKEEVHTCIVCGRPFHEGQGIVIRRGDLVLEFHSARCASKFLRLLVERSDASCVEGPIKQISKELREAAEKRREGRSKVIA